MSNLTVEDIIIEADKRGYVNFAKWITDERDRRELAASFYRTPAGDMKKGRHYDFTVTKGYGKRRTTTYHDWVLLGESKWSVSGNYLTFVKHNGAYRTLEVRKDDITFRYRLDCEGN